MNILLATTTLEPQGGGIASYNQELIEILSSYYNIIALVEDKEHNSKLKILYSDYSNINNYDYAKSLINNIYSEKIDLIINSSNKSISVLSKYISIPIISISHFTNGRLALLAGYNQNYLNHIIVLSHYAKNYIINKFKIKEKNKVIVLYNTVKGEKEEREIDKENHNPLIIVFPGGASFVKGSEIVLKAVKKLINTNLDFRFIWLGNTKIPLSKYSIIKNLKDLIQKDNRIHFLGNVKRDISLSILKATNIFILPSKGEGCAMTLLEAIKFGCIPIVSNSKHASPEILKEGKFGIILKHRNSSDLYYSIVDIITNHEKYINHYSNSYNYYMQNLEFDIWCSKMINIINKTVNSKKRFIKLTKKNLFFNILIFNILYKKQIIKQKLSSLYFYLYYNMISLSNKLK